MNDTKRGKLSDLQRKIYQEIIGPLSFRGTCNAKNATIASRLRLSESEVINAIRELKKKSYIRSEIKTWLAPSYKRSRLIFPIHPIDKTLDVATATRLYVKACDGLWVGSFSRLHKTLREIDRMSVDAFTSKVKASDIKIVQAKRYTIFYSPEALTEQAMGILAGWLVDAGQSLSKELRAAGIRDGILTPLGRLGVEREDLPQAGRPGRRSSPHLDPIKNEKS